MCTVRYGVDDHTAYDLRHPVCHTIRKVLLAPNYPSAVYQTYLGP